MRKPLAIILIGLLFMSAFSIFIPNVKATGTIYIMANGSIEPPTAPIQRDGDLYTFTDDIYDPLEVHRSNIVVDGAEHTLEGQGSGGTGTPGILVSNVDHVTIKNTNIKSFYWGILASSSNYDTIVGNNITNHAEGIRLLAYSSNCTVNGNNITANSLDGIVFRYPSNNNTICWNNITANSNFGIQIWDSSNNSICENTITNNFDGIGLIYSSKHNHINGNNITANNRSGIRIVGEAGTQDNDIRHNNFVGNAQPVQIVGPSCSNYWDGGYPSGGNYWSDFTDLDMYSGPGQDEPGCDGIWDHPYVIDEKNQDNYPLVDPWIPFEGQTIYIRASGDIDPSGAPITRKGELYTLAATITSHKTGIIVERNNVEIDGAGQILRGQGYWGTYFTGRNNITIRNMNTTGFIAGIAVFSSSSSSIIENNLTNNGFGIALDFSSRNNVTRNNATGNLCGIYLGNSSINNLSGNNITKNSEYGVRLHSSSNNSISGENIAFNNDGIMLDEESDNNSISDSNITTSSDYGIQLEGSSNNHIYHNNFIDNNYQVWADIYSYSNRWDDGHPSGGNYWSDYTGVDVKKSLNQDQHGSDGIGDAPYTIDQTNRDRYPLMYPYGSPKPPMFKLTIAGVYGGTTDPEPIAYTYSQGQSVPVQAIPYAGYVFLYWVLDEQNAGGVNPLQVPMNEDHWIITVFAPTTGGGGGGGGSGPCRNTPCMY